MDIKKMDSDFEHWLAGFVAGEGCFCIYAPNRKMKDQPVNLLFSIKLRQDDLPILQEIQAKMGCGNIRLVPARGKSRPTASFVVSRADDLMNKVVPLFRRVPLRAKKARDFEIWAQAVELFCLVQESPYRKTAAGGNSKWNEESIARMTELSNLLRSRRKFKAPELPKQNLVSKEEVEKVSKLLSSEMNLLDAKNAASLLGMHRQGLERARRDNRVVSVRTGKRRHKYPDWQFSCGIPLKRLSLILKKIGHVNQ